MSAKALLPALKRLTRDYKYIVEHPSTNLRAHPTNDNIFFWYFVFIGPPDTPYANGQYFGSIRFPNDYPNSLPKVFFYTPNGRFETNTEICFQFANTKYWDSDLSVNAVLLGIVTFMCTSDEITAGWMETNSQVRRDFAKESKRTNCEQINLFKKEFPELYERNMKELTSNVELEEELPLTRDVTTETGPEISNDHDNLGKTNADKTNINAGNTNEINVNVKEKKKHRLSNFVSKLRKKK